jgi:CheY-like chemotaxis protein
MSNAIKFTPRRGRVEVRLVERDGEAELSVTDTGAGIAREFLPRIFDRFTQADATLSRQHGGLGLGLAIVRHLVELHGGTVSAESDGDGKGSTFTVRIPVMGADAARAVTAKTEASPSSAPLDGLRVLVVDDDSDTRDLLQTVLKSRGAKVIAAASAAEALKTLASERPDAMLCDLAMPESDGYDLLRELKRRGGAYARLPVAALTAHARPEDRHRAIEAGFDSHIAKPVDPDDLAREVVRLVRR